MTNKTSQELSPDEYLSIFPTPPEAEGEEKEIGIGIAEGKIKLTEVRPIPSHPPASRYNYMKERWETAAFVGVGERPRRRIHKNNGMITAVTIHYPALFDDWDVDMDKMDKEVIDDKYFVTAYRDLFNDDGTPKAYASLAYLSKKWKIPLTIIKRQRTKIVNAFKKHFPNKTVLPELPDYTNAEAKHKKAQANESIYSASSADDFLSAFGMSAEELAQFE